jgi:hypothetical protein
MVDEVVGYEPPGWQTKLRYFFKHIGDGSSQLLAANARSFACAAVKRRPAPPAIIHRTRPSKWACKEVSDLRAAPEQLASGDGAARPAMQILAWEQGEALK